MGDGRRRAGGGNPVQAGLEVEGPEQGPHKQAGATGKEQGGPEVLEEEGEASSSHPYDGGQPGDDGLCG